MLINSYCMDFIDWMLTEGKDNPIKLEPVTKYKSYRFRDLDISKVTVKNYNKLLVDSLAEQVEMFVPPSGSFDNSDLRRYLAMVEKHETSTNDMVLGLSLADQIRIAFSDMQPATICDRFPDIDLNSKRRYRCVAEYLLRQEELVKVRDREGKLVKKIGNAGKPVVLYRGLPKLLQTLKNSDLLKYVRHDRSKTETSTETTQSKSN